MSIASILNSITQAHPMADRPYIVRCNMRDGSTTFLQQEGTLIRFVARHEATAYPNYGKADAWMRAAQWDRSVIYTLPEPQ